MIIGTGELNNVCLKAVRREVAHVPSNFTSFGKLRYGEDLLLSAQFLTEARRIVFLKEGLYHYRIWQGSITHIFSLQRYDSIKCVHEQLEHCIDRWGLPELHTIHNARKVKGCIDTIFSLLNSKHIIDQTEIWMRMEALHEDPYFVNAYHSMDRSRLRIFYQILAVCLYFGWYEPLQMLVSFRNNLSRIKHIFIR